MFKFIANYKKWVKLNFSVFSFPALCYLIFLFLHCNLHTVRVRIMHSGEISPAPDVRRWMTTAATWLRAHAYAQRGDSTDCISAYETFCMFFIFLFNTTCCCIVVIVVKLRANFLSKPLLFTVLFSFNSHRRCQRKCEAKTTKTNKTNSLQNVTPLKHLK